jgi:hypothetical protein
MTNELRASALLLPALVAVLAFSGCASITGTETSYKSWVGDDVYQGKGGAVEVVNGVEIWEHGEPNKPYKVIGLITQSKSDDSVNQLIFGKADSIRKCNSPVRNGGQAAVASWPFVPARMRSTDESLHAAYPRATIPNLRPDESRT